MYQVGRNSFSQPKNATGSNPGVQTTAEPATRGAKSPEIKPCAWDNGSTFSDRSRGPSCNTALALKADRQTFAWVRGTIFGCDVVLEVKRMNASSSALGTSSALTARRLPEPRSSNAPEFSSGRSDKSMTGIPRLCAMLRLADSTSARVNSTAGCKSPK